MREVITVMPVRPQLRERLLVSHEPGRDAVRRPLGYLGQGETDLAQPRGQVIVAVHTVTVPTKAGRPGGAGWQALQPALVWLS
jgi:hypothetical protein